MPSELKPCLHETTSWNPWTMVNTCDKCFVIVDRTPPATPAGDDADLLDEIAEAISDTLDMDWQPSWASPNILALINRERAAAYAAGEAKGRADERTEVLGLLQAVVDKYPLNEQLLKYGHIFHDAIASGQHERPKT